MHLTLNPDPNPNPTSKHPTTATPIPIPSDLTQNPDPDPTVKTPLPPPPKTTTYHIYPTYQNPYHALITQQLLPKSCSARRKYLKRNPSTLSDPDPNPSSPSSPPSPSSPLSASKSLEQNYYLHLPTLTFHSPPRTLRRGSTKTSPPICIIHNSPFWRRWRILTGPELMGAIDPRGLLPWERRSCVDNCPSRDEEVKGYRVRRWRAWGESGKQWHRVVNERKVLARGRGKVDGKGQGQVQGQAKVHRGGIDTHPGPDIGAEETWNPVRAEEVLPVTWMHATPFSKRVRWYSFVYKELRATWKGSREIPTRKKWSRRVMPVHHLKLVVEDPCPSGNHNKETEKEGEKEEVILARYSSSISKGKHGTLVIFDEEVRRVFGCWDLARSRQDFAENREKKVGEMDAFDVIVATAMCMVLGEWQKRKTVVEILLALLGAGAEGGASMG